MQTRRPTIKDVARRAGVSFKTVSRVINEQDGVRDEVRARVRQAVAELGYVVNYSARTLASGTNRTIGVVIPRITDPRVFDLLHHIGEVSEQYRVGVIILTRPTLSDEITVSNFVGHGMVGALLLISPLSIEPYLPIVQALQIPTIVCESVFVDLEGRMLDIKLPCIASDNRGGARQGVDYLFHLGHRRIAYISGGDVGQNRLRFLGYCDALAAHDVPSREEYVRPGDWSWESGHGQALKLLELPNPPTAILCASDNMALGAMRAVAERGLHVPSDVSILGFDDIPQAAYSDPPLSTIRQPAHAMVQMAIEVLICGMEGRQGPSGDAIMPTTLVERQSCVAPKVQQRSYSPE
jgi:DNA-binding LacI/PurR family transcriptional regulator